MQPADWTRALTSVQELRDLYETPPDLSKCSLSYLHIDERDRSVTLGMETEVLPSPLPDDWQEKGLNTCEFYIVFRDADNVRIHGWDASVAHSVAISGSPQEGISVAIGTEDIGMEFQAGSASAVRVRGYLASKGE